MVCFEEQRSIPRLTNVDQGWTTEDTKGTYETSSWFEVSIFTPKRDPKFEKMSPTIVDSSFQNNGAAQFSTVEVAAHAMFPTGMYTLVRLPNQDRTSETTL